MSSIQFGPVSNSGSVKFSGKKLTKGGAPESRNSEYSSTQRGDLIWVRNKDPEKAGYLKFVLRPGSTFSDIIPRLQKVAHYGMVPVMMDFNRAQIIVKPEDFQKTPEEWAEVLSRKYHLDAQTSGRQQFRIKRKQAEKREEQLRLEVDRKIANQQISLKDPEAWQSFVEKNKNSYGAGVIRYAERWAKLMEYEMAQGKELRDIAKQTSYDADNEGMSGGSFGLAVTVLAQTWKYGEELRRWNNLKYQFGDEGEDANKNGGVLNPARFFIKSKD